MCKILYKEGKPLKIALIGGARTGKDTIAEYLGSVAGFTRLAFGDAMKEFLFSVFQDPPEEPKPREAMIGFAQSCREIDPDVWVKHLHTSYSQYRNMGYENFVITDVRQENEIAYCRREGYLIIKVEASNNLQVKRAKAGGEALNTFNVLDTLALNYKDYDLKIENNGSLLDLYKQIDTIIQG